MATPIILIAFILIYLIRLNFISLFAQQWNYTAYRFVYRRSETHYKDMSKLYHQIALTPAQVIWQSLCIWKISKESIVKNKPFYKEILW